MRFTDALTFIFFSSQALVARVGMLRASYPVGGNQKRGSAASPRRSLSTPLSWRVAHETRRTATSPQRSLSAPPPCPSPSRRGAGDLGCEALCY